jgi:4'-phosphopantetheinyl transferase
VALPWRLVIVHDARATPGPVDDLVRVALVELGAAACDSRVRHHCLTCGSSDHGRPWLERLAGDRQVHLSVARCPGRSVVALSDAGPLGVDVERSGSAGPQVVDQVLGSGPGDATRRWVRAEARLKAAGHGFARPAAPTVPGRSWSSDLDLEEGYEAAVAVLTAAGTDPDLVVIQAAVATPSR